MLPLAFGLWWGGHLVQLRSPRPEAVSQKPTAFAIPGSAYGSLAARLLRDSLYSYWHGGEGSQAMPVQQAPASASAQIPPPPPAPGRFARRGQPVPQPQPVPEPEPTVAEQPAGLDGWVATLAQLEKGRTRRNSAFPLSAAHRRYVDASATTRLRLAYSLDPGDAVLYEILHFHLASRSGQNTAAALQDLTTQALSHGLRPQGSLSDALTAAGAAINILNDQFQPGRPGGADPQAVQAARHWLKQALAKYDALHDQAIKDGWWEGIPPIRRGELQTHAAQLHRLAAMIESKLSAPTPEG